MGEVGQAGDLLHLHPAPLGRLDALDDAGQLPALVDDDGLQPGSGPGGWSRTLLLGCRGEDGLTDGSAGRISTALTLHLIRAVPLDNLLPIVAVKLVFQSSATGGVSAGGWKYFHKTHLTRSSKAILVRLSFSNLF